MANRQQKEKVRFYFCFVFVFHYFCTMIQPIACSINVGGRLLSLSRPLVMGIINATPDSFYAASRTRTEHDIAVRADNLVGEGAAIIDVGACSTRPGSSPADADEEMSRLRTALAAVRRAQPDVVVSVDTFRPDVAKMAVEEYGVTIINDISEGGVGDVEGPKERQEEGVPEMFAMVARLRVPYILTSVRADMDGMLLAFAHEVEMLHGLGVADIILDPGFGFGKDLAGNYAVMARLNRLHALRLPILVGVSRKSMVTRLLGCTADEALHGTTALHAAALLQGASILRVHDVRPAVEACRVVTEILNNAPQGVAPAAYNY
jgi:dihydropteroate synthase